jgi:hypothetical protein
MRRIDAREVSDADGAVVDAFNKCHANKRVKVEWGIGGMKMKFRVLQSCFPWRRSKFITVFKTCAVLTNFIHRRRGVIQNVATDAEDGDDGGWYGDI